MIHIMTYDLHGSTENHTGHHSALYSRTGETGDDLNRNVVSKVIRYSKLLTKVLDSLHCSLVDYLK